MTGCLQRTTLRDAAGYAGAIVPTLVATLVLLAAGAQAATLKIATILPDGSSWMTEMRRAASEIAERTEGRVKLKFYPGGVMGNDQTVLRKMRVGQLHGGAFPSGALAQAFPDTELYSLPLLFRSYGEVDYVREKMDDYIEKGLYEKGYVALAVTDGGFAHVLSGQPVRRVEDLKEMKVWILEGDVMSQTAFDVAGVSPVPLPIADVYTGLQTGLIDTVAGPAIGVIAFQWHTKLKYLTDVPLMYLVGILAVDRRAFDKISADDQAVVREVVRVAGERLDADNRKGEIKARQALRDQGVEFVSASSAEEIERWHEITAQAEQLLRETDRYSDDAIERLHQYLDEYRGQHPEGQ